MKKNLMLLCLFAFFTTTQKRLLAQSDAKSNLIISPQITRSLIDSIQRSLYEHYIFPDTSLKMTAYLKEQLRKGVYNNIREPADLAKQLTGDLRKIYHDGHLRLLYSPGWARELLDTAGLSERQHKQDSVELLDDRRENFTFSKVEILPGNVGYIAFRYFTPFVNEARPTFTSAFQFVSNAKAVIIDLRKNRGGSPDGVILAESYFFPTKTHLNDIVDRSGKRTEYLTDPEKCGGVLLMMPVYILTSRLTFSAAESFAYGMQNIKRTIVVGDTTGGGAHPVKTLNIGFGFVATIPFARSVDPNTGKNWEGTGVYPNISVPSEDAQAAALKDIFKRELAQANTEKEKRIAQWQLNNVIALEKDETLDSTFLAPFAGIYKGGLYFFIRNNQLFCKNPERGNEIFQLHHITGYQFLLDDHVQIEFTKDNSGIITGIKMFWSSGDESFKAKER